MIKRGTLFIVLMVAGIFLLAACSENKTPESSQNHANTDKTDTSQGKDKQALPDALLKLDDKGQNVKELKQTLDSLGYDLSSSRTFDADTQDAIKDVQSQQVKLAATGVYDNDTKKWLQKALNHDFKLKPGKGFAKDELEVDGKKSITVKNPKDVLALVNKEHALPHDYEPDDLVTPDVRYPYTEDIPKKKMRKVAAKAMEKMFAAGDKDGVDLFANSGYRSYDRQKAVFDAYVESDGKKKANKYSAKPGESEHQSGLTMDVTSPDIDYDINEDFAKTDEGKWLKKHAHEYGFIIRYPKDKVAITEYQYEPWHIRYVGKDVATVIHDKDLTLEEYLGAV